MHADTSKEGHTGRDEVRIGIIEKNSKALIQEIPLSANYIPDIVLSDSDTILKNSHFISVLAKFIDQENKHNPLRLQGLENKEMKDERKTGMKEQGRHHRKILEPTELLVKPLN